MNPAKRIIKRSTGNKKCRMTCSGFSVIRRQRGITMQKIQHFKASPSPTHFSSGNITKKGEKTFLFLHNIMQQIEEYEDQFNVFFFQISTISLKFPRHKPSIFWIAPYRYLSLLNLNFLMTFKVQYRSSPKRFPL